MEIKTRKHRNKPVLKPPSKKRKQRQSEIEHDILWFD